MEEITQKVASAISLIRPFLNDDGGDVELVEVTKDHLVKVRLTGLRKQFLKLLQWWLLRINRSSL
jgi:hypothetical protein